MLILRYTDKLQQALKSNVKSEPWLHCVIYDKLAVIYVWDSRQVVAQLRAPGEDAFYDFARATDNNMPLQGLGSNQWLNAVCSFTDVTTVERIRALLTQRNEPQRTIACLKAIYRIWESQSTIERETGRHTGIDGIGFSRRHIRPMSRVAKLLSKNQFAMIGQDAVRYACNVAPFYSKQLACLANGGIKSPDADRIERSLRTYLQKQ